MLVDQMSRPKGAGLAVSVKRKPALRAKMSHAKSAMATVTIAAKLGRIQRQKRRAASGGSVVTEPLHAVFMSSET
jgi:hypothetical protein